MLSKEFAKMNTIRCKIKGCNILTHIKSHLDDLTIMNLQKNSNNWHFCTHADGHVHVENNINTMSSSDETIMMLVPQNINLEIISDGRVVIENFIQGDVKVDANQGITVDKVRGNELDFTSNDGDIHINKLAEGMLINIMSNKKVTAAKLFGNILNLDCQSADVKAAFIENSKVKCRGNLNVGGFHGNLHISMNETTPKDMEISSMNGSINADLQQTKCTIHFDTIHGSNKIKCNDDDVRITVPFDQLIQFRLQGVETRLPPRIESTIQDGVVFGKIRPEPSRNQKSLEGSGKINSFESGRKEHRFGVTTIESGEKANAILEITSQHGKIQLDSSSWMDRIRKKHFPELYETKRTM